MSQPKAKRDKLIVFRVTAAEWKNIVAAAERAEERTLSEYARTATLERVKRGKS